MGNDWYLRGVLTVIAAALVYMCVLSTPLPTAFAQTSGRPGELSGPTEVVIIGWRLGPEQALPVEIPGRVAVTGEVRVSNDVRVTGRVQAEQVANGLDRVVLAGWEDHGSSKIPGHFQSWLQTQNQSLPVTVRPSK